jgi:hypothetical protein
VGLGSNDFGNGSRFRERSRRTGGPLKPGFGLSGGCSRIATWADRQITFSSMLAAPPLRILQGREEEEFNYPRRSSMFTITGNVGVPLGSLAELSYSNSTRAVDGSDIPTLAKSARVGQPPYLRPANCPTQANRRIEWATDLSIPSLDPFALNPFIRWTQYFGPPCPILPVQAAIL